MGTLPRMAIIPPPLTTRLLSMWAWDSEVAGSDGSNRLKAASYRGAGAHQQDAEGAITLQGLTAIIEDRVPVRNESPHETVDPG